MIGSDCVWIRNENKLLISFQAKRGASSYTRSLLNLWWISSNDLSRWNSPQIVREKWWNKKHSMFVPNQSNCNQLKYFRFKTRIWNFYWKPLFQSINHIFLCFFFCFLVFNNDICYKPNFWFCFHLNFYFFCFLFFNFS